MDRIISAHPEEISNKKALPGLYASSAYDHVRRFQRCTYDHMKETGDVN